MQRLLIVAFVFFVFVGRSQTCGNVDTVGNLSKTENSYSKFLYGDSLSTSFCILIKKAVKAHKHQYHSEQVIVLEGEAIMQLAEKSFAIKKGDVIFIPKNTVHAVKITSKIPLKIISVQAPHFDGSDRVFVE
jgi:mannose-6-phosphate isomerase-like protein (cupin superfamily)